MLWSDALESRCETYIIINSYLIYHIDRISLYSSSSSCSLPINVSILPCTVSSPTPEPTTHCTIHGYSPFLISPLGVPSNAPQHGTCQTRRLV